MSDKYLVSLPPRSGKTAMMEALWKINIKDKDIDIPVEKFIANPKEVGKLLLPETKFKCPEC